MQNIVGLGIGEQRELHTLQRRTDVTLYRSSSILIETSLIGRKQNTEENSDGQCPYYN